MSAPRDRPMVFTIDPGVAFVDALAAGLRADAGDDPLALAAATVLLPTRRAARSLREAFLRLSGGTPLLLPRMMPLNDVADDDALLEGFTAGFDAPDIPPAIAPLKRQLLLAQLIKAKDAKITPDRAAWLAADLAAFLDQVQTERVDIANLEHLVQGDLARHWQLTVEFLSILFDTWPAILAEQGCIDPAEHRNRVFAAQGALWQALAAQNKLLGRIIAAGSTGSIPATADLLAIIARLPRGCVVLPGLDLGLDDDSWAMLDDNHPQVGMKLLLARIGVTRDQVRPWPAAPVAPRTGRRALTSELMRPAETTDRWRDARLPADALDGVTRIDAPTPRAEASAIAIVLRAALETPGATAALVTPDRDLAERTAAELGRWGIDIDDSAGRPLELTPPGVFLRLVAQMIAEAFAPVPLLAVCKHPLAAGGLDPAEFRAATRRAEIALLRGPRPAPGLAGLRALRSGLGADTALDRWLGALADCCATFEHEHGQPTASLVVLLDAHMRCAEALAASHDRPGAQRLWAGEAGEAAAGFAAELAACANVLPPIAPSAYPEVFLALLSGRAVRPRYGRHPRLAILGPLEARLQQFDTIVLGGLNEGTWPAKPAPDPWMSRPMRKDFGLPSPERRIGLAAHDIAQALCAPQVVLTRAAKVDGTPTVPSRWLMRLEQAVAATGLGPTWNAARAQASSRWLGWSEALVRVDAAAPMPAPAPRPPVAARPRRMSVTRVEEWRRDPYATYARFVLGLRALDPLDQDAGAADYGSAVHAALHRFVSAGLDARADDALARLLALGDEQFAALALRPGVAAFWRPRFARIARWFVATERDRRVEITASQTEVKGTMLLQGPAGPFELTATADRIDVLRNGALVLIDYKTGAPPSQKEIAAGFAPQLPLEAAIAIAGGFAGVSKRTVEALEHWRLDGRREGGSIVPADGDATKLAAEAHAGLKALIAVYDDPATPYPARPHPAYAPKYSDYQHLARLKEWAALGGDGE
ncbi:MAG: double-strand break repair protein AddB [Rhodospirillaceae bacterium]|nr:double-strand break repair protein AddB [Rhodospirillaceae bacterium]